jgi:FlaA1/EpsC-like NDP-sugar epimerase
MTVTHPEMTRFFMTIEEAAGLVVEACHLAGSGEIFVLDMGQPVRILDVAQSFAQLMHHPDVEVRFTGMREGEKLNESLFSEHEQALPTQHARIFRTTNELRVVGLHQKLRSLYDAAARNDAASVRGYLRAMLPDYHPQVPTGPCQTAVLYADDY